MSIRTVAPDPSGPSGHLPSKAGEERKASSSTCSAASVTRHPNASCRRPCARSFPAGSPSSHRSGRNRRCCCISSPPSIPRRPCCSSIPAGISPRRSTIAIDWPPISASAACAASGPRREEVARLDADLSRATWDPDGCCAFRKVAPLQRALAGYDAWISGRKRFQASTRFDLPVFEADDSHVKVNPLASWSAADISTYVAEHRLPPHPLVAQGYLSISCAPCTSIVASERIRAPAAGAASTRPNAAFTDPSLRQKSRAAHEPASRRRPSGQQETRRSPRRASRRICSGWRTRRSTSCARSWPSSAGR